MYKKIEKFMQIKYMKLYNIFYKKTHNVRVQVKTNIQRELSFSVTSCVCISYSNNNDCCISFINT